VRLPTSMQLTISELEGSQIAAERARLVVPKAWLFFLALEPASELQCGDFL